MDLGARRHYVASAMEFLLILSAMLSAVTGAVTGARTPEPRAHHAQSVQSVAPASREAAAKIVAAPQAAPATAEPREAPPAFAPPAPVPLYADRLIE